jgi:hypothetical protein
MDESSSDFQVLLSLVQWQVFIHRDCERFGELSISSSSPSTNESSTVRGLMSLSSLVLSSPPRAVAVVVVVVAEIQRRLLELYR